MKAGTWSDTICPWPGQGGPSFGFDAPLTPADVLDLDCEEAQRR